MTDEKMKTGRGGTQHGYRFFSEETEQSSFSLIKPVVHLITSISPLKRHGETKVAIIAPA